MNILKVNKPFSFAKKNDEFVWEPNTEKYNLTKERKSEDGSFYSVKVMNISKDLAKDYCEQGVLQGNIADEPDPRGCYECCQRKQEEYEKLCKLQDLINDLRKKYNDRNDSIKELHADGNFPQCLKVEHDTVYYNLMKLLNKFEQIINE